jgi:DNA-binding PadR family transcriptional regulator
VADEDNIHEINRERFHVAHYMMQHHNWMRHTAMVPKGFIRFQVLKALNEKPMSGSELMEQIEKDTGKHWRPSPGSIYPLLSWLQDNNYIKEQPPENGLKRYELTSNGKALLKEQTEILEKFRTSTGFMSPSFFDGFCHHSNIEKAGQFRESLRELFISTKELSRTINEKYAEQALNEASTVLKEAAKKIDKINSKYKTKDAVPE